MYASYFYVAGASEADVLNDIVAILAGETNVNNLSNSCDKTNTQIKTDYSPSGWTLEGKSTSQAVLSSPHTQDTTRKKLLVLDSSTFSSGYLKVGSAHAFDPSTFSFTNSYFLSSTYCPKIDLANGGRLEIYADERIVLFYSYTDGTFSKASGVAELDISVYDNKGWGLAYDSGIYCAQVKGFDGLLYNWLSITYVKPLGREPKKSDFVEAARFLITNALASSSYKILSELPSIYELPDNFGAVFDTIVFPDGKTYVLWDNVGNGVERIAVPWG
ncbi:hypothetical protein JCM9492_11070 [Aquifex pyrophilus]